MKRQYQLKKWTVLWSAIGIGFILGILYVWSVISKGLMNELGWSSTQASLPYTVFTVCMALGFFTSGRVQDKIGPRMCVVFCAVMMGVGLILSGVFTTPGMVTIFFGIICGAGVGAGNAASLAPTIKWFPSSKKGMVSGAVLAGIGFSAVIYSPLSNFLLGAVGVSNSFLIFGVVSSILMFLLSFNMFNPPPGYDREKGSSVEEAAAETIEAADDKRQSAQTDNSVSTKDMLKTVNFYIIFVIFAISSASGLMIIAHAAKIAQVQARWEGGFLLVIVLNLFNTAGRFLGGSISDRIGRVTTLKLALVIQALNMLLFRFYADVPLFTLGIMVQGFCYGTIFTVMPPMIADLYGLKNFGSNHGTLFLAWGIGGVIGPMTAASVYDASVTSVNGAASGGSYFIAYLIACGLSLVSLAMAFMIRMNRGVRSSAGM